MSAIVNDRDVRLRATSDRTTPAQDRALLLAASANVIRTAPGGGSPAPAVVTLTAVLLNMAGNVTWSAVPALDMTVSGNTALIAAASFGSSQSVVVTAKIVKEGITYEAKQTVVKVADGASGTPVYTWIKYADSAVGSGISDSPAGKTYIGLAYNKSTPIESDLPGDYSWSLIKGEQGPQGPQGNQGVQGPVGPDGKPTYTWIAYSDSPNGANMYQVPTATTTYIGIAPNKTTDVESSNPADYVWSKFKGDQGVQGPQGPDGKSTYTWIKYASSAAGAGLSDSPAGKDYIGFAYNKPTDQESANPADYTWSLIKGPQGPQGPQGTQGVQGPVGPDGKPTYTWIAYSDSPNGANMYQVPTATTTYIGIAPNKTTDVESSNPADYVWSKFKGDQGVQGPQGPQGPEGQQGPRGPDGDRGTVDIAAAGHTAWSDTAATNAVINAGYGYPQNRDRVTLYGSGFAQTRFYSGGSWLTIAAFINGNMLISGTLSASVIDGGELKGVVVKLGPNNDFWIDANGTMFAFNPNLQNARAGNLSDPTSPAMRIGGTAGAVSKPTAEALRVTAGTNSVGAAVFNGVVTQTPYSETEGKGFKTNNCVPVTPNTYNCGTMALPWMGMTSNTAVLIYSDERIKDQIVPSQLGLSFINALQPVSYVLKEGHKDIEHVHDFVGPMPDGFMPEPTVLTTPVPGTRRHFGLIAQQVRATMVEHGVEDAAFWALADKDDPDSQQALRYEELIAPLIRAVQELSTRLHTLQDEVNLLKGV